MKVLANKLAGCLVNGAAVTVITRLSPRVSQSVCKVVDHMRPFSDLLPDVAVNAGTFKNSRMFVVSSIFHIRIFFFNYFTHNFQLIFYQISFSFENKK